MSRRKTLLAGEIPKLNFETDIIDDDAEKRRRISERFDPATINQRRVLQQSRLVTFDNEGQRASSTGTPGLHSRLNNNVTQPVIKPSNEQLSCLYNNCVKLLNENKINVKNAFQLKLIDYMSDIVLNKELSGGVTNFQVVGCTIDVGTKIYAARVDALHQNTYQVLSGLNHTSVDNEENNESNRNEMNDVKLNENDLNDSSEENPNSKKAKTAKKRRLKKSTFIVTSENMESITLKTKDEFKDEDLYFSKKSTCIEHEAIAGILLNKLHVQNDSIKMLINADDQKYSFEDNFNCNNSEINFKSIVNLFKLSYIELKNLELCSDLSNFKFIDYHLDENDELSKLVESIHGVSEDEALEAHRFDANNLQMSRLDISLPTTPENIDDFNCNDIDNEVENMDMESNMQNSKLTQHISGLDLLEKIDDIRSMNSIADLSSLISTSPSDYSYFNFDKLKLLNLPKHLKQIACHLTGDKEESTMQRPAVINKNAKLVKKITPRIDLTKKLDNLKFFKITKKSIYLCDRTIERRSEKPSRLETERQFNYEAKELFQPYLKKITAKIVSDIDSIENLLNSDDGIGLIKMNSRENLRDEDYDGLHLGAIDDEFEIPCTAQTNGPFFSQHGGEFIQSQNVENPCLINPNNMEMINEEETGLHNDMPRFEGENLIQVPLQVNALNIEYAKTSKNIDVRRLKQVIWSLLCNTSDKQENLNNLLSNESNSSFSKQNGSVLEIKASLKNIYTQLRPPLITQRVYDDLSICIVFQMILFLANEHNLLLKNDTVGSDVLITNY